MPQTLEEYHAKIERMMAEGEAWLIARDAATGDLVKQRIADSALVLASYQLFVHREVFAPMLERADARTRARVNELKVECIALTEDLRLTFASSRRRLTTPRSTGTISPPASPGSTAACARTSPRSAR